MVGSWKTRWFIYIFPPKDKTTGYLVPGSVHWSIFRPGTAGSWIRLRHRCLFFFFQLTKVWGKSFLISQIPYFWFQSRDLFDFWICLYMFFFKEFVWCRFFVKKGIWNVKIIWDSQGGGYRVGFAVVVFWVIGLHAFVRWCRFRAKNGPKNVTPIIFLWCFFCCKWIGSTFLGERW